MQNGCQFHIKFQEEYKNELNFNRRSWRRMKYLPMLYHTIRSYFTSKVEFFKRQLEITDINFRRIYEDNRILSNGTDLKFKFKIFNMGVDFIQNLMYNPAMNSNFIYEVEAE